MSWKDDYREHYEETDLTWGEYHEKYFTHEHELDDLRALVDEQSELLEALTNEVKDLKRELHTRNVLDQKDE